MVVAIDNPIGIDAVIAQVKAKLMALETIWGVTLDGYPRCYPITKDSKKTIAHFVKNKDYKPLIYAEGNKFFFTAENDAQKVGYGYETTTIELYFIVNLVECKPDITHRADNEVRVDVKNILAGISGIEMTTTVIEIDRVFAGYDSKITDDMQPYHAFRINLNVYEYRIDQPYCII